MSFSRVTDLHYLDEGSGPAVLLVHAFPLNHTMWAPQIAALKDRFRVIAPDIRGFGNSPTDSPWTLEDASDDLDALLTRLNITTCAVVGLSMGGYIALPFYAKYANRIHKFVLADTRARADNLAEKSGRTDMIAALEQAGAAILPDRMLSRLLKPNSPAEIVDRVRQIMQMTTAAGAIFALMAMRDRPDASTILHRITCPALVIAGEHDAITRVDECRTIAETINGGRFVEIPHAGHLSNIENPQAFNAALTFL
jgi:3-oxoadipate enol-lactonase